mmetsp:Transcript_5288/g.16636  ORF Transcript_5288/g.16636 Transcript_5288/m.16636 type:complete len:233 (+) Transcript_5288:1678-2376(+)
MRVRTARGRARRALARRWPWAASARRRRSAVSAASTAASAWAGSLSTMASRMATTSSLAFSRKAPARRPRAPCATATAAAWASSRTRSRRAAAASWSHTTASRSRTRGVSRIWARCVGTRLRTVVAARRKTCGSSALRNSARCGMHVAAPSRRRPGKRLSTLRASAANVRSPQASSPVEPQRTRSARKPTSTDGSDGSCSTKAHSSTDEPAPLPPNATCTATRAASTLSRRC